MKQHSILKKALTNFSRNGALVILVIAVAAFAVLTKGKNISLSNIVNILTQVSSVGIMAVGMTMVIIDRGIDLSVGGVACLSVVVAAVGMVKLGLPWYVCIVFMIITGLFIGFVNGILIAKLKMQPFICTMAMLKTTQGIAYYIMQGKTLFGLPEQWAFFGQSKFLGLPICVWLLIILGFVAFLVLKYSRFGRELYAMGGNPQAAWMAGINVDLNRIVAYMISSFCATVAGLIISSRIMCAQTSIGDGSELDAIASAVIGGVSMAGGEGGVVGAIIGAIIISVINNGLNLMAVSPYLQTVIKGLVIFFAVIFDIIRRRNMEQLKVNN
ncbi:MAG: ABC transporter permease [Clostridia bacterium]|nr:ABC transporter permease [Clostridia bacterium]